MAAGDLLAKVSREAERRGFESRLKGYTLEAASPELPISVFVEAGSGDAVRIRIEVGSGLEERIAELAEEVEDVRGVVEEVLETAIAIVDYAAREAQKMGFKAVRETRQAVLDVYDALESIEESLE